MEDDKLVWGTEIERKIYGDRKGTRHDHSEATRLSQILPKAFYMGLDFGRMKYERDVRKKTRSIFIHFMLMVLEDCIENGNKFMGPGIEPVQLYIRRKHPASIRRAFTQKNIYNDVDILKSDANIYEFNIQYPRRKIYKRVRISHRRYKRIVQLVNEGKRYWVK